MLEDQDDLSTGALTLHPRLLRVGRGDMAQLLRAGPLEPGDNSFFIHVPVVRITAGRLNEGRRQRAAPTELN